MHRATPHENARICVVCNRNIKKDSVSVRHIDGLCLCSQNCADKFMEEKKKWSLKEWDELCKLRALYGERKRAEIDVAEKELSKI